MSTIRSTGDRVALVDEYSKVFVQGAYNLGAVYESKLITTTAFAPGMFIDPVAAVAGEDSCIIGASGSVVAIGLAEVDFAQVATSSTAYQIGDEVPLIMFHSNWGALCHNIQIVDAGADTDAYAWLGTTSGTNGKWKADVTSGAVMRQVVFCVNTTTTDQLALISTYAP